MKTLSQQNLKRNFTNLIFIIALLFGTLNLNGCGGEISNSEAEKMVTQLWSSNGAKQFLINENNLESFFTTGLKDYPGDTAKITKVEILEKKEADKTKGENLKEIKMVIKVSGSVNTYKDEPNGNHYKGLLSAFNNKNVLVGEQNFSVKHIYYFVKDKYGDWSVNCNRQIVN